MLVFTNINKEWLGKSWGEPYKRIPDCSCAHSLYKEMRCHCPKSLNGGNTSLSLFQPSDRHQHWQWVLLVAWTLTWYDERRVLPSVGFLPRTLVSLGVNYQASLAEAVPMKTLATSPQSYKGHKTRTGICHRGWGQNCHRGWGHGTWTGSWNVNNK